MVPKLKKVLKTILVACGIIGISLTLAACGKESSPTDNLKLTVPFTGKKFIENGIGEATLLKTTDGDTATFTLKLGGIVTIRFYGIDTPESTGSVEKWGKSASKFTEEKLVNAKELVLEASTTPASVDSYGSRYLGYVWYRNSENEDFRNLNLEVVENGYSENDCINTPDFKYYSSFKEAENIAKSKNLHIWSDDIDPYYSTAAEEITLKDFTDNPDKYYNKETNSGSKVRFEGFLINVDVSSTYVFTAEEVIDGVAYYIHIYAGYPNSAVCGYMKIGNKYSFTGTVQERNGGYQISGLTYVAMQTGGDYLSITKKNHYAIFNSNEDFQNYYAVDQTKNMSSLNSSVTITKASVSGTTLTIVGNATPKFKSVKGTMEEYTFKVTVSEGFDASSLVGKTMQAFGVRESDRVILIQSYSNLYFN